MVYTRHISIGLVAWVVVSSTPSQSTPRYDFHGLLLTCGLHPTVHITGHVVYAYEPDLTTYTLGTARLGTNEVTVSFPRRFSSFTISKHGARFFVGPIACQAEDV